MCSLLLATVMDRLFAVTPIWHVLWAGLACLSLALFVLSRTRWGQSKPLHKCAVLSLLAHVLLACLATTVQIVTTAEAPPTSETIRVALLDGEESAVATSESVPPIQPWEEPTHEPDSNPKVPAIERPLDADQPSPLPLLEPFQADDLPPGPIALPAPEPVQSADETSTSGRMERKDPLPPAPVDEPRQEVGQAAAVNPMLSTDDVIEPYRPHEDAEDARPPETWEAKWLARNAAGGADAHLSPATLLPPVGEGLPVDPDLNFRPQDRNATPLVDAPSRATPLALPVYRHRAQQERVRLVQQHGGTIETEAAVKRALTWLARAQSIDGRWDAVRHGAGREMVVYGHDRKGAGAQADTGVSGLALLAFLGAGHTQIEGHYTHHVQKGLNYLIQSQKQDGNLAGDATLYARMYCHAMATFALSEAYVMTGDAALSDPVRKAVAYTVAAQHSAGGWRYRPGDPGDTSLLGWQLMALRSAELAGETIPETTWHRAGEYLQSVSRGSAGGLAAYQPGTGVSRAMSAEGTYCKLILAERRNRVSETWAACDEAAEYVRSEMPGVGRPNLYYWYYATLLLHLRQHDGPGARDDWKVWNDALQRTLLASQHKSGPLEGAWGSDTTWGGYGGRVYTTAIAALCLETYYRYLPALEVAEDRTANRPGLLHQPAFDTRGTSGKIE